MDSKSEDCLTEDELEKTAEMFEKFHERYSHFFNTTTRNNGDTAKDYISGQIQLDGKGTMTNIPKKVDGGDYQAYQHFISNSPWDEVGVIDQIQKDVSELIGDEEEGALVVDGVGFPKQGKKSAGVARQWCGRLGKVENCQVGVFLGYVNSEERILMDKRLFLPEKWINDEERRIEAGIPEDIEFKTKPELALDMISHAEKNNVPFGWINADDLYGRSIEFRQELNDNEHTYMVDIPCDTKVWLSEDIDSTTGEPKRAPRRVDKIKKELEPKQMERLFVRDTERKELWTKVSVLRVHPVKNNKPLGELWLIIRKNEDEDEYVYQFSNAPQDTTLKKLVKMSYTRYWIERSIEDAKGEVGLADYEVRKWKGWHHHMTMCMLAMLLLLEVKLNLLGEKN